MAISNTDTKLRFLYGKYANLPSTKTEGTVYITTDEGSQNMFVDIGGSRIRLHKFMIVDSIPGSVPDPVEGVVYYGKTGNILAYHNGSSWVQINSQRLFQSYLATFNSSAENVGEAGDGVRVTSTISPDGNNENDIAKRGTAWQLTSGQKETTKIQVTDSTTTTISGDTAGGANRTITVPVIKVTSANTDTTTTFKVTDGAGASAANNVGSFKLVGTNKTTGYNALGEKVETTAADVTAMTVNVSGGRVTVASGNTATINTGLVGITPVFDANGNFKVNVEHQDGSNATTVGSVQPKITVGVDENKRVTSYFKNGEALLNGVYTAAETDSAIEALEELINENVRAAQAMQYKGVLSTLQYKLPTANVSVGDTYVVDRASFNQTSITFNGPNGIQTEYVEVGDMFIAYGTEGDDGYVTSDTLLWHYIPAGNDTIAEYRVALTATEFSLSSYLNGDLLDHLGSIKVGNQLKGEVNTSTETLTISHADIEVAQTPATDTAKNILGNNDTFTVVTGVTIGENGHVTNYTTTTYTVKCGLNNDSSSTTTAAYTSGTYSGATVKPHIEDYNGNYAEAPFTVTTTTAGALAVSASGNNVNIELIWGTFDPVG